MSDQQIQGWLKNVSKQTLYKFDDTLGGDFARFDADFSFSQTANITSTFDASAFRFDSSLTDMGLTFDNTAT